jgi:hypothetical protein
VKKNRAKVLFPLCLFLILVLPLSTVLLVPSPTEAQEPQVFESYGANNDFDFEFWCFDTMWLAQTFTAESNHPIAAVKLPLYRSPHDEEGEVIVSIMATDSNGKPSGPDLASGSINGNIMPADYSVAWYEIQLSPVITVTNGTRYAIVVRSAELNWMGRYETGQYHGGALLERNSDGTWISSGYLGESDAAFQVLGSTSSGSG